MNGKGVLLVVLAVIVAAIGVCGGALESVFVPHYTTDEIRMVQPNGFFPERDGYYAQGVNVPNSEANKNNAEAQVYNAQATAIVRVSGEPARQAMDFGMGLGSVLCIGGLFLLIILLSLASKVG